ncbi:MAG TPA: tetratricopeptide repeat protein [Terriglobales bacterium]|nr:tetratricopeptide repeat protein [Terriglobales bacterium]
MNSPVVSERRSAARAFSKQIAQIRSKGTGAFSGATTRDVSSQAGYFYTDVAFAEGQQVEIEHLDLPSDGVIRESGAKYAGRVLRLDEIEPQCKYGIAVAIDRLPPALEGTDSWPDPGGQSVSLLSKTGLFFQARDVRVATVALVAIICAFLATSLALRGFRHQQALVSEAWYQHGESAIAAGKPETAIKDFRAILVFAPDTPNIRVQLAEALISAGKFDDAKPYYVALRESDPDSGSLNLALARLEARTGNAVEAQRYYRAAIAGSWAGDAVVNRQRTRLELVRYYLSRKAYGEAQPELVLLFQNAPDDLTSLIEVASLLMKAGDPERALTAYKRALAIAPQNESALLGAGEAAYAVGRYVTAQRFLAQIVHRSQQSGGPDFTRAQQSLSVINDLLSTFPSPALPTGERADRVLRAWDTATRRLAFCANVSLGSMLYARSENEMPTISGDLATTYGNWRSIYSRMKTSQQRRAMRNNLALQSQIMSVAFEIEQQTAKTCGTPTGTDQALLRIAQHPEGLQR